MGERGEMSPRNERLAIYHATFHNAAIVFNILTIYTTSVHVLVIGITNTRGAVRESRVKGNLQIRCAAGRQNTLYFVLSFARSISKNLDRIL